MKNDKNTSGQSGQSEQSGKNAEHNRDDYRFSEENSRRAKTLDKESGRAGFGSAAGLEEETRDVQKTQPRSKINPPEETQETRVDSSGAKTDVSGVPGETGPRGVEGPNRRWKKAQDEQQEFAKQPGIDETDLKQHDDQGNPLE